MMAVNPTNTIEGEERTEEDDDDDGDGDDDLFNLVRNLPGGKRKKRKRGRKSAWD